MTMQDALAKHLTRNCAAWGIGDAGIAANEMSRVALEFLLDPPPEVAQAVARAAWHSGSGQKPEAVWRAGIIAGLNPSPVAA